MKSRFLLLAGMLTALLFTATLPAFAQDCTTPNGYEPEIEYFTDDNVYRFCNGTEWVDLSGGGVVDSDPASFTFTDLTGQATSTLVTSNIVTLTDFTSGAAAISGSGSPEFRINGGSWTSSPTIVNGNDTVQLRVTTSSSALTAIDVTFSVEGTSDIWSVTTTTPPQVFSYNGTYQSYTVPTGITSITVKIWGAGGGGAGESPTSNKGGAGGYTTATVAVTPGGQYTVVVGGGGPANNSGYPRGSPGGGLSGLFTGTAAVTFDSTGQARALLIAGGGGGAAGYTSSPASGGAGGGSTGGNGGYDTRAPSNYTFGAGGTQSAGGAGGPGYSYPGGNPGSALRGGSTHVSASMKSALYGGGGDAGITEGGGAIGGGGGAGYFGGGGGAQGYTGDGGGGSGYCKSDVAITSCTTTAGSGQTPPQTGDSNYASGIGVGGPYQTAGGHGRVVIVHN